jgi:hypothetical protein
MISCLFLFILLGVLLRQESSRSAAISYPAVNPSPNAISAPDNRQKNDLVEIPAAPPNPTEIKERLVAPTPTLLDKTAVETRQKLAADLKAELRERTRNLYGAAFKQLGLPANIQERVIDILTQQQQQLEQEAFETGQSGNVPEPPSPDALRAEQGRQDQQLRSVLGNAAFAQFEQYRATIPDHIIADSMNQQGANLTDNQSQQLVQILTTARQQIIGQAGIAQNLSSMSPAQAVTFFQQQQSLLQQAVGERVQNLLTPEQATTLKGILSQNNINPKGP